MAARQASLKNASTLLPPTPIEHSCNSSLASSPTVKTAFFYKPGRGHRVGGLALNTVVCAANDGSRPQRWRSRRGNPCSAVAAPEAPQTSSKPLFDSSVLEEEYGWVSELDGGAFLDGSSRGSDSRGGKSDLQRRRWELVTALGAEARRAVLEVGDAAEAGEVREGKLGRLQKLLEVESVGEEENREDSGGVTLAEAFTLDHGGVLGEVPDSRDEAVRPSQEGRGGQKVGTPSTPDKARSQRSQKVPRALIWEGVRFGKPSVKPRAEQPANGAKQGALLVKGGSLVGEEKNEALPGTNMTESFDVDLGVEEDIEVGLESDLATLFAGTGNEAESGPLGGSSESVLLPRGAVPTSTDPLEVAPAFQQPGKINLVTSLQYQTSETFVRGSSPRTLTSTLKTGSIRKQREPSTNQKGSEPSISGGLFSEGLRTTIEPLQEPSAVFDPLLDVLEDASGAKALASIPLHQRTSKTQHVLKRRQQKALLASDEDETMLRQPWEVEEVRPKTGPPIGLELFADDRRTSSEVRARAFEPKHDKTPGGGKQWQPNKRRLYYAQKFANRWGGGETPEVENPPKEVEVLGGDVEKPPVEENHFLFPPLPRPVPHEIVNRKKVETMPVGSFRSVPPKQRKVLSMREAAAVSRGLGGRLVVPGMGSSEVTLEMREDARRGVLQQLLAATEGGLAQVLDEGASSLHSKDVTFLLYELSTRGATNRALEVLRWAEKAPKRLARLRPGTAAYAIVLQGLVREGDAKAAEDFAVFTRARGKPPGAELCGLLLTGLAGQGEHGKVWEVLDRLQKRGASLDGRAWRGLISACARGDKRLLGKLVGRVMELAGQGEVKLTRFDYEEIVGACSGAGLLDEALTLVETMEAEGFRIGADVYGKVMCAMSKAGQHNQVLDLYRRACQETQGSIYVHNAAIRSLCHLGRQLEAREVVQRMLVSGIKPDVVTYNTIIGSLSRLRRREEALEVLEEMQKQGCQPTPLSFKALGSGREP